MIPSNFSEVPLIFRGNSNNPGGAPGQPPRNRWGVPMKGTDGGVKVSKMLVFFTPRFVAGFGWISLHYLGLAWITLH